MILLPPRRGRTKMQHNSLLSILKAGSQDAGNVEKC